MPNFPSYSGELPEKLHPLNPRHYLLLAYWVFFRPTALQRYFYQASPELYQLTGWQKFYRSWRYPAYRQLYLMLPAASLLLAALAGLGLFLCFLITVQGNTARVTAITCTPQVCVTAASDRALKVKLPSADATLKVWDWHQGKELRVLKGHKASITTVAMTSDNQRVISGGRDRHLKIWDLSQGKQLYNLKGHQSWINQVALTPDNQQAVSASADGTLRVWDLGTGKELHLLTGHTGAVLAVAIAPDGKQAVSAGADGTLRIWDLQRGKELHLLKGHNGWVTAVAITPDGKQVVSAGNDSTLRVWDLSQGKELHLLSGHTGSVTSVAISPDGKQIVSAATDNTLRIWDLEQGKELHVLKGHNGWVTAMAITPDGKQVVSASSDYTLRVWDLEQGQEIKVFKNYDTWVTALAITPDSQQVVSGAFDRYPKMWSLASGKEMPFQAAIASGLTLRLALQAIAILTAFNGLILTAIALAINAAVFGLASSIISSLGFGLIGGLIFSLGVVIGDRLSVEPFLAAAYGMENLSLICTVVFGVSFGLVAQTAFGLVSRKALGAIAATIFLLTISAATAIIVASEITRNAISLQGRVFPALDTAIAVGVSFNLLVILGAFRLPLYPGQLAIAFSRRLSAWHPINWDELLVFPLPRTNSLWRAIRQRGSEAEMLRLLAQIASNPFQRSQIHPALFQWLHQSVNPVRSLYFLLTCPDLDQYNIAPISPRDWQNFPTSRQVLLAAITNQKVNYYHDSLNQIAENILWQLGFWQRQQQPTALTHFATVLYQLLYLQPTNPQNLLLGENQAIYINLEEYPEGQEISRSFATFTAFLSYNNIAAFRGVQYAVLELPTPENAIRPKVIIAINRLTQIAATVAAPEFSSQFQQLAILVRAMSDLAVLDEYITQQVAPPEQTILQQIIRQWQQLIHQAAAQIVREQPS